MTLITFSLGKFLLALLGLGVVAVILGRVIVIRLYKKGVNQEKYVINYNIAKRLIDTLEPNANNYERINYMIEKLDSCEYVDRKLFTSLWHDFQDKFRDYSPYVVKDFLPESDGIKVIPE